MITVLARGDDPPEPPARFKPTRAGIINLWDYLDEEFAFADGRLALRGHNGSGKTKALEVLFPFVLDGSLDARRLDPFSGENRTMKANVLYRGQDAEHGYVWMEFARPGAGAAGSETEPGETVTLIIGLVAHRNRDRPKPSFYVTDQRMGADFGLLSADSRPLTAKQLTEVLGRDACYGERKGAYQDAVDARLFGLGRERYTQLLDLLIALRRPLLAKDLDPAKVSDTLTNGLSPVDEELLEQAARDFENLAAVQKQYDDLAAADGAVTAFLEHYGLYLRVHTRHQLDQIDARITAAASHVAAITTAAGEVSRAEQAEHAADESAERAGLTAQTLEAQVFALKNRDAYTDHEKLALRRTQLEKDRLALGDEERRLARARGNVTDLRREADGAADKLAELGRAAERHTRNLAEAAQESGLIKDGEPADTGADLALSAKARVAQRKADLAEVRSMLSQVRDAERDRSGAESAVTAAQQALASQAQAGAAAEQQLASARAAVTEELRAWASRWNQDDQLLVDALDRFGEADAPTIGEVFTELTKESVTGLITLAGQLDSQDDALAQEELELAGQRTRIEAEHDDAPGGSDLRPAGRDGRAGAPLWQLVDFQAGLDGELAAGLEGALYGAGLLTAWVHPDQARTTTALRGLEADGYLVPLAPRDRPGGRTLADLLVPEHQELVDPARVAEILASIAVVDDLAAGPGSGLATGPAQSFLPKTSDHGLAGTALVVSTRAQYGFGPLVGARPKPAPEFIGATNRAHRRQARLAELDQRLATIARQRAELATRAERARTALADVDRARSELPKTATVTKAREAAARAAVLLTAARDRVAGATASLDKAVAELDARNRRLRHTGADREIATSADLVDAAERAVADFERAAADLVRAREDAARLDEDLAIRRERIERLDDENDEAAEILAGRQAEHRAESEKLAVDERASGAEYEQIKDEILVAERDLRQARRLLHDAEVNRSREHDSLVRARADLDHGRDALGAALAELTTQALAFGPYAQGGLRLLLEVDSTVPWPEPGLWPSADRAAADLAVRLAGSESPPEPDEAIRALLPPDAVAILDAFAAATRNLRALSQPARAEAALKSTVDRMWSAYREFETALKSGEDGYQADLTGDAPFVVDVVTNTGRQSAAEFARKVAEDVGSQGVLLEQRERTVLEDSLLTALAQQIHARVRAAKDLVDEMDADTRSKPMSSGMAIGIRWVRSDKLTDKQAAASRLLDTDGADLRPEGLAELRGLLRAMIHEHRAANPRDTYREVLGAVLDYRSWHTFELRMISPGGTVERLTRKKHSEMSGGEKSATIHMPLFAAANALYSSAKPTCPRLVALDEAFAGIDDKFKPELLGLTVRFDLDLFMTGHDLWVTFPTVPAIAHYDLEHDKAGHTVSAFLAVWDGLALIDAGAGYAGNDELAMALLGFRPSRHVPADADDVLVMTGSADDDSVDDELG